MVAPFWIARDTLSMLRAIGADDQSGRELLLSPFVSQVFEAGPFVPAAKLPTGLYRVALAVGAGVDVVVEVVCGGREADLRLCHVVPGTGFSAAYWGASNATDITAGSTIVTPNLWHVDTPTAIVRFGTAPAGLPTNFIDGNDVTELIRTGFSRIPRGRRLVVRISNLAGSTGTVFLVVSDIGPVSREVGG